MKKTYLLITLLIMTGAVVKVNAQCTPNSAIGNAYIYPAVLPFASVGIQYNEVLTFRVPSDSIIKQNGFDVHAHVDSAKVILIKGMPAGYTYACNTAGCVWPGGTLGCALFSGITNDSSKVGSYPMKVYVFTWAKLGGTPPTYADGTPYDRSDSSDYTFKIVLPNGIFEIEKASKLKAYPNPFGDRLHIEMTNLDAAHSTVEVIDPTGKRVYLAALDKSTYQQTREVDLNNFAPGLYVVVLRSENSVAVQKVLKQ